MKKYEKIAAHIEKLINDSDLRPNDKLPALRQIAQLYRSSIGTVKNAYNLLEKRNIVYSVSKSGHYLLNTEPTHGKSPLCLDFYSGSPDLRYMPYHDFQRCINRAVTTFQESLFTYDNIQGMSDLLEILRKYLSDYQVYTNLENIVVVSGSQQALDILCRMEFPNGNRKILVEQPTYYGMLKSIQLSGSPRQGIMRGFDGLDFDSLKRILRTGGIKFLYTIPRYHNPTGQSYSKNEMKRLVELADRYDVYLVEDDIAGDFDTDPKRVPLHFYDTGDRVVYLRSFSKIMMPGLRIAAVVLPARIKSEFLRYKEWTDTYSSILSQGTLAIYLSSGLYQRNKIAIQKVYSNRMAALRAIAEKTETPEIRWSIPDSSFFACMRLQHDLPFAKIAAALRKNNIRLMDTSNFFLDEFRSYRYHRISVSKTNEEEIREGIPKLLRIMREYC